MPLRIVRNDITKMNTEAIVNTANESPVVGPGCDTAIYVAAGYEELLKYRQDKIGTVKEGDAFITPGYNLKAKYVIHTVSPHYIDGEHGEEALLRSCYRKSLALAGEHGINSIAFPLIATGGFGYPKEEGLRIAVDEINAYLISGDMLIYLVVFDNLATRLGEKIYPDLEEYIDHNYVEEVRKEEYEPVFGSCSRAMPMASAAPSAKPSARRSIFKRDKKGTAKSVERDDYASYDACCAPAPVYGEAMCPVFEEEHESKLEERMRHLSDTFSEYLMYLIQNKNMENAEVWKRAIIDKKVFSKIKTNRDYHPQKLTALCLCIGAKLNLDESKDLLARAGYALSPCDKTDIIFSYFIENEIYDMIELDIQLEEHGLPCIIA